ncbi:putative transposase of the Rover1 hAT-like family [Lachancea nothofagi CBS 11611]|uniref:Putative transposase of the Rover1 hAT-like family n=1 Tax=Lachancea nothofagi CBS 11611 TaxID=1266666 RepID=A0A1G4KL09_9SACH|nr:putative transposase of the Rover1 hAT-like family [Lachancea nothofagi CBS 11611]
MDPVESAIVDKANNAFAEHREESEAAVHKSNSPGTLQATNEETIAAAITQLNSHQHEQDHLAQTSGMASVHDYDSAQAEQQFRDTYGFDFRDFSINPCLKPNLDLSIKDDDVDPKTAARFDNWLRLSPFGIWVSKFATSKPYAQCKYSHCQLQFKFDGHANTSNIIKHMKRRHKDDYELFISLLGRDQNRKPTAVARNNVFDQSSATNAATRKALAVRKELAPFLQNKQFPQKQLNVFIDSLLPLSTASSFVQFLKACNFSSTEFILSPEDMVLKLDEYFHEFEIQLKETLKCTSLVDVILQTWSSSENKSFLAVMVSFCPNLVLEDQILKRESITVKAGLNVHVLDLIEIDDHASSIVPAVVQTLTDFGILQKMGAITLDSSSNTNSVLAEIPMELRKHLQAGQDNTLIEIRSLSHIFTNVAQLLIQVFQENYPDLMSRIDHLASMVQSNIFLKKSFKKFWSSSIGISKQAGPFSKYRQLCTFLEFEQEFKTFYIKNVHDESFNLQPGQQQNFCYTSDEATVLKLFLKAIGIFFDYLKLLQNGNANILTSGIDYYLQIGQYFQACDRILSGIFEEQDVIICGLRDEDLLTVDESNKNNVFTVISTCSSYFNAQIEWVFQQAGYWVAHMLQPHCKTARLSENFEDAEFKQEVLQKASTFVLEYLKIQGRNYEVGQDVNHKSTRSNSKRVTKPDTMKKRSGLELVGEEALANLTEQEMGLQSEWAIYLDERIEESTDFTKYWLRNQKKFPALTKLALSLYNSKLSSDKVETWFNVGHSALKAAVSQASMSLKQALMIRNRLLCFEPSHKLNYVEFVAAHQWATDENLALGGPEGISDGISDGEM